MADRYLKVILTIIALELGFIAVNQVATPASAQANGQARPAAAPQLTPVVIRGVDLGGDATRNVLPIAIARSSGPVRIEADRPIKIEADRPIRVEAERPLKVESVPYTPSRQPGE